MSRRHRGRHKHTSGTNHERWVVSYADFITLLFVFFAALYAISNIDKTKAVMVAMSTREAFHDPELAQALQQLRGFSEPVNRAMLQKKTSEEIKAYSAQELRELYKNLKTLAQTPTFKTFVIVQRDERGMVVSLGSEGFFKSGSADIKPNYLSILEVFTEKIVKSGHPIRAEGHPDDIPIQSSRYRNNWELSTSRAVSVVQYLTEVFSYPAHLLSVAGYGDTHPIVENVDDRSRSRNRRVDLVVIVNKDF